MRKITRKERKKAGNIYCPYCKPKRVDAVWRADGHIDMSKDVACNLHRDKIVEIPDAPPTDADHQTWMKL